MKPRDVRGVNGVERKGGVPVPCLCCRSVSVSSADGSEKDDQANCVKEYESLGRLVVRFNIFYLVKRH